MNMHRDVVPWLLMPTFALRAVMAVLVAALLLSIGDIVLAQPKPAPAMAEDQRLLPRELLTTPASGAGRNFGLVSIVVTVGGIRPDGSAPLWKWSG
jgi:hypothetical protein